MLRHAFQPYANPERNAACVRCGRPSDADVHKSVQGVMRPEAEDTPLQKFARVWNHNNPQGV